MRRRHNLAHGRRYVPAASLGGIVAGALVAHKTAVSPFGGDNKQGRMARRACASQALESMTNR